MTRDITKPAVGYWATRLRKGGPEVGMCIVRVCTRAEPGNAVNLIDRSSYLVGYIAGEIVEPHEVWTRRGRPITEAEYRFLLAEAAWTRRHASWEPTANPKEPVDLKTLPAILP